jgi:prepilin-type processing-associated H-X9-DG protein
MDPARGVPIAVLHCPADPTKPPDGTIKGWSYTNYLANYNAWAIPARGPTAPPTTLLAMTDGTSNIVLFGEGYADCDRAGRYAMLSWYYHSFGIDWYGQANTLMFQDQPRFDACDNWRAQSNHRGGMNVALADSSVRVVAPSISQQTWTRALLPTDGQTLGSDW